MCVLVSSSPKMPLAWLCMRYADSILATRDFSVDGNVASMSALFPAVEGMPSYTTFEANFRIGSGPKKHAPTLQQQSRRVHPLTTVGKRV